MLRNDRELRLSCRVPMMACERACEREYVRESMCGGCLRLRAYA